MRQIFAPDGQRIAALDGFRALAVLSVLAYHYTYRFGFTQFRYGWMGVELFFVVSGFVIPMTLRRCRSPSEFARRRFARLWPALVVGATLTAGLMNFFGPPEFRVTLLDYLTSLVLIDPGVLARMGLHTKWVDGAYWTLWVELRFYFWAGLLYFAAGRRFLKAWIGLQVLAQLAVPVIRPGILELFVFPSYLPYFTIGTCAFELSSGTKERKLALAGALFAAAVILWNAASGHPPFAHRSPIICIGLNLAIFGLFGLLLTQHRLLKPFTARPMVLLGQASYSLYLLHENIGVALLEKMAGVPFALAAAIATGACVTASIFMFAWIEVPARRWLTQARQPWPVLPATASIQGLFEQ